MNLKLTGEAAELFAASWCNLDCTYCNIPKHNQMIKDKHQTIIKEVIAVTPIIDRLTHLYGDNLTIIGHWGSEPTLTLQHFKKFYHEAIKVFKNLNTISLSSNFMTSPSVVSNFIINDLPKSRKFTIEVQMSIDGEEWATEVNRGVGTTKTIQENIVAFIQQVNDADEVVHTVGVHFKPTMSKDQYEHLLTDDNLANHYQFFDNLVDRMVKANHKNRINISKGVDPTAVCPDKYTKRDGEILAKFYAKVLELNANNNYKHVSPNFGSYYSAMDRILKFHNELFTKARMFTCSAGDSQFGISEYLHPCHDTFYMPYDEVQDAIRDDLGRINSSRELDNLESGRTAMVQNSMFVKIDGLDQEGADKYVYLMRGFHDFFKFRISTGAAVIKIMAKCGQVSPCYNDEDMALLLATFSAIRHSCLTGNVQYSGSMHLTEHAYFKLFGNGLLEQFVKKGLSK